MAETAGVADASAFLREGCAAGEALPAGAGEAGVLVTGVGEGPSFWRVRCAVSEGDGEPAAAGEAEAAGVAEPSGEREAVVLSFLPVRFSFGDAEADAAGEAAVSDGEGLASAAFLWVRCLAGEAEVSGEALGEGD